jgi:uncharacterized protein
MDPAESRLPAGVEHVRTEERFVVREGDDVAELDYHRRGNRLSIVHTGVPPAMERRGTGSALVRAAVEYAAAEGLTVVPSCSFARWWLEHHPDAAASVPITRP